MVTGVAGLLFAVAPSRTQQEVFDLLVATAEPIGVGYDAGGHSLAFGYGRVDAAAALAAPSDAAVIDEPGPGEASCQDYWACLHTCEAPAGACDVSCRSGLTSAASASLDALLGCIEDHKCYEGPEPFESCLLSACGVEVDSCFGTVASGSSEGLVPSPGSRDVATTTTLEIGAPADDEAPELDAPPEAGCGAGSHSEPGGIPSGWLLLLVSTLLVTRWGLRGAA